LGKLKGEIYFIRKSNDNIALLNQSVTHDSTYVLSSNDNGKSWNSVFSLSNKYFVSDMYQRHDEVIELSARVNENNNREVFRISNKKTDTIRFAHNIRQLHFSKNGYLGVRTNFDNSKSLIHFNLEGEEIGEKNIATENIQSYSKRTSDNDIIWYYSSSNIVVFRNDKFYEIDLTAYKDYTVKDPFIKDSLIVIDGYYNNDASFVGVIHTFLVSYDFGITWIEEDAPSSMMVGASNMNKERFISYSGLGKFQERK